MIKLLPGTSLLCLLLISKTLLYGQTPTNVFPEDGNVGIGTTSPSSKLTVSGNSLFDGPGYFTGDVRIGFPVETHIPFAGNFAVNGAAMIYGSLNVYNSGIFTNNLSSIYDETLTFASGASFQMNSRYGLNINASGNTLKFDDSGNLGIGVAAQSGNKLHVNGLAYMTGFRLPTNAQNGYVLTSDANGNGTWQATIPASPNYFSLIGNEVTLNDPYILRARNGIRIGTSSLVLLGTTTTGTTNDIYSTNGPLYVQSNTGNNFNTILNRNGGNVGVGILNPTHKLAVNGSIGWGNNSLNTDQGGSIELGGSNSMAGAGVPYIDFHYSGLTQDYNVRIINDRNGELRILAANGLAVEGRGLIARRIRVNTALSWADYVFNPSYKLMPLLEVDRYIKIHKHLPDVPTEEEVKTEGFDLAEMNKILLQKIEENTLYLIELKKENDVLKEKIVYLEKTIQK